MAPSSGNSIGISPVPPQLVDAVWSDILPLLRDALDVSENEVSAEYVRQACLNEEWDLWIVTRGSELTGFVTLEPLFSIKGFWINIAFAGFGKDLAAVNACMTRIEEVGSLTGACGVKYISADRRFGSFAKRKGYRERYREYVKEF